MSVHSFLNVFTNPSAQTECEVLFSVLEVFLGDVLYLKGQPLGSMYCTLI